MLTLALLIVCGVPGAPGPLGIARATAQTYTVLKPVAAKTMRTSSYYPIVGFISPTHKQPTYTIRVYRYHYEDGKWRYFGYVHARAVNIKLFTKYYATIRLRYKGKWRLRTYLPEDHAHPAAWSGYTNVTVK